ncbi:MAG TPA: hypothetical protein VGP72_15065 [Planctomycetota bacterium]|jgi:type II secretory pathway pseudopilin PulG
MFPRDEQERKTGFTLLETLVVIGLIVFLLSIAGIVYVAAIRKARVDATRLLINQIGVALTQYYANTHAYPPDTGYGLPMDSGGAGETYDPGSLWRFLSMPVTDKATGRTFAAATTFSPDQLIEYNDPKLGKSFYVVDSWGKPIGFVGDPKRVTHNLGSFDLFSGGPDGVTASTDGKHSGSNLAYNGADDNGNGQIDDAGELGPAALNGTLADDINNWKRQ